MIDRVTQAYYDVLNATGQLDAAQANLQNASTVQQDAEARRANGLATLPDVLETRSATAQARLRQPLANYWICSFVRDGRMLFV